MAEDTPNKNTEEFIALNTSEYLQLLVGQGIAIADPTRLRTSLDRLLNENGLDVSFLNDRPKEAVLLTAVASMVSSNEEGTGHDEKRAQILTDAVLGRHKKDDDARKEALYVSAVEKFTNKQLSAKLTAALGSSLFSDIYEAIGVTPAVVQDVLEVKVLDIASSDSPDLPLLFDFDKEVRELYESHQQQLKERARTFSRVAESFEGYDTVPAAWMNPGKNGARNRLLIPSLVAEGLLVLAETDHQDLSLISCLPIVSHEIVHGIGNLIQKEGFFGVGLMLEERRAEFYSGDKNGYPDLKTAIDFVLGAYGKKFDDLFPKYGTFSSNDVFQKLASFIGLENMLDLATAIPESYDTPFRETGGFDLEYLEAGNGINDALLRILRRMKSTKGTDFVQALISNYVDGIVDQLRENGTDIMFAADNIALRRPAIISVLAIKDFQRRYPNHQGDFDWSSAFKDIWETEI